MGHPLKNYRDANQAFGSYATQGVVGNPYGTEVQRLVADYGNYQPFGHAGADYPTPIGTPVYAISDGTVLWAGWAEDLPGTGDIRAWLLYAYFPGIVTVIQHWWGISLTAHMSEAWLNVGDAVKEGQQIGLTGNTKARGQNVGAHVHIEALVDLGYRTQGDMIYGRVNPERFYGTLANTGTISQEDDLANVSDRQLERLLTAADRVNGVITDPNAKVLTTNDVPAIAKAVLKYAVPLRDPSTKTQNVTGTTDLETKAAWLAYNLEEARQDAAKTRERVAAVESKLDKVIALLTPKEA